MSDLPPKGTPSLVIIISDSLIVASRILRLSVSFYSVYQTQESVVSPLFAGRQAPDQRSGVVRAKRLRHSLACVISVTCFVTVGPTR